LGDGIKPSPLYIKLKGVINMLEKLLEIQKQIIEYDKLVRQEIANIKLNLDEMSKLYDQIINK
jgi:hypothetical protein